MTEIIIKIRFRFSQEACQEVQAELTAEVLQVLQVGLLASKPVSSLAPVTWSSLYLPHSAGVACVSTALVMGVAVLTFHIST